MAALLRVSWRTVTAVVAGIDAGGTLGFLEETRGIREDDSWRVTEPVAARSASST